MRIPVWHMFGLAAVIALEAMAAPAVVADSTAPRAQVGSERIVGPPVWSANGDRLLISVSDDRDRRKRAVLMRRVGSELKLHRELQMPWGAQGVRFGADGLLYTLRRHATGDVYALSLASGRSRRLIRNGLSPTPLSNGDLLFERPDGDGLNLHLYRRATGQLEKLTKDAVVRTWVPSPAGRAVAVLYKRRPLAQEFNVPQTLAVVSLEGDHSLVRVDSALYLDYGMAWSDEGKLVFGRFRHSDGAQPYEFSVVEFDIQTRAETVRLPYGALPPPAVGTWFSADGKYVSYPVTSLGADGFLHNDPRVALRGDTRSGDLQRLRFPFDVRTASLSPDGELLVVVGEGGQLAVGEWASGTVRRIPVD